MREAPLGAAGRSGRGRRRSDWLWGREELATLEFVYAASSLMLTPGEGWAFMLEESAPEM